jgi:glucuronosyltransferase
LHADLQEWMDRAADVIIVSFGSRFGVLPSEMAAKFFDAFSKVKYRFLFRFLTANYDGRVPIPENVRIMEWLPQNDVLGHTSTRAFITHSGNNGQYESLYHGVPMLCFYIDVDQQPNAKRAVKKGTLLASRRDINVK